MGVTAAAHMPHVTSSSYPSLQAHLQASHQALRVSSWSLSIRLLRSTLDDDKSRRGQQSQPVNGEAGQGNRSGIDQSSVARRTKFMYQVIISDYPDDVFVLVEDPERPTRATMRIEAAQRRSNNGAKNSLQEVQGENKGEGDDANPQNGIESDARDEAEPNVDAGKETGLETQPKEEEEKPEEENKAAGDELLASDTAQKDVTEVITIDEPDVEMIDSTASKETAVAAEEGKEVRAEEEASEEVKAAPRERNDVPPTTRFSLFAAASSFPALLTSLNLPPALGAPSLGDGASSSQSAAGPGAWLPRGAPLVIEGATWELPSMEGSFASEDRGEWKIRLGLVMHGGTRSGGALVEVSLLRRSLMHLVHFTNRQSTFP